MLCTAFVLCNCSHSFELVHEMMSGCRKRLCVFRLSGPTLEISPTSDAPGCQVQAWQITQHARLRPGRTSTQVRASRLKLLSCRVPPLSGQVCATEHQIQPPAQRCQAMALKLLHSYELLALELQASHVNVSALTAALRCPGPSNL